MRFFICAVLLAAGLSAQSGGHDSGEKVDLYTINRIRNEAFQNSKVMENAFYLTDVYGPRLTGSPGIQAAAEWAVRRFILSLAVEPRLQADVAAENDHNKRTVFG